MGDARHQKIISDHNLGNAVDITHDAAVGCTGDLISSAALEDARVSYVIWNKQINTRDGKGWVKYKGSNPHTKHCHISIRADSRDDESPWAWGTTSYMGPKDLAPASEAYSEMLVLHPRFPGELARGASGSAVTTVQALLKLQNWAIDVNGRYGDNTQHVVRLFQLRKDLEPTGIVDFWTWKALWSGAAIYPTLTA